MPGAGTFPSAHIHPEGNDIGPLPHTICKNQRQAGNRYFDYVICHLSWTLYRVKKEAMNNYARKQGWTRAALGTWGLMVTLVMDLNINSTTMKLLGYIIGQSLDLRVGKDLNTAETTGKILIHSTTL